MRNWLTPAALPVAPRVVGRLGRRRRDRAPSTVTSWPSRASNIALVSPPTPPPITTIRAIVAPLSAGRTLSPYCSPLPRFRICHRRLHGPAPATERVRAPHDGRTRCPRLGSSVMHVLRVVRVLLPVLIVAAVVGAGSSVLSARPDLQKAKRNVDASWTSVSRSARPPIRAPGSRRRQAASDPGPDPRARRRRRRRARPLARRARAHRASPRRSAPRTTSRRSPAGWSPPRPRRRA